MREKALSAASSGIFRKERDVEMREKSVMSSLLVCIRDLIHVHLYNFPERL